MCIINYYYELESPPLRQDAVKELEAPRDTSRRHMTNITNDNIDLAFGWLYILKDVLQISILVELCGQSST